MHPSSCAEQKLTRSSSASHLRTTSTKAMPLARRGSTSSLLSRTPTVFERTPPFTRSRSQSLSGLSQLTHQPLLNLNPLRLAQSPSNQSTASGDGILYAPPRSPSPNSLSKTPSTSPSSILHVLASATAVNEIDTKGDTDSEEEEQIALSQMLQEVGHSIQQLEISTPFPQTQNPSTSLRPFSSTQSDRKEEEDTKEDNSLQEPLIDSTSALEELKRIITQNDTNLAIAEGVIDEEQKIVDRNYSRLIKAATGTTTMAFAYAVYREYQARLEKVRKIRMVTGLEIPVALSAFKTIGAPFMTLIVAGIGWWRFKKNITRPLQRKFEQKANELSQKIDVLEAKQKQQAAQLLIVFAGMQKAQKELNTRNMEYLSQLTGLQLELHNTRIHTEAQQRLLRQEMLPKFKLLLETVQNIPQEPKKRGLFGKSKKDKKQRIKKDD